MRNSLPPEIPNSPLEIWQREIFRQLIIGRIIEIVATRCQIIRLKCTKFDFGWAPPQTPLGELTAIPTPLAAFKGPISRGREEEKGNGREG